MKRTVLSLVVAGVIASGLVLVSPSTARADHRRSSVGVFVGSGGFSVGVGYGSPYRYGYYAPYRTVVAPVVVPSCCHYERVYVPEFVDAWGAFHPGFYQTYRVCDHHGRVLVY